MVRRSCCSGPKRPVVHLFFYLCPSQVPAGHIESHTFATSTLTQFCILFKRTLITICRDQVGDRERSCVMRSVCAFLVTVVTCSSFLVRF